MKSNTSSRGLTARPSERRHRAGSRGQAAGRRIFLFLLLFFTTTLYADELIIEPDMGRAPIINALNASQHSIKLTMYGFTDRTLLNALVAQKNKNIQIILEHTPYKAKDENKKAFHVLRTNHIPFHGNIPPYRLVHQKTLILDNKKALVMTFNFTRGTFKNERNFGLFIDDPKEVVSLFDADWTHTKAKNLKSIIVSPENSQREIIKLIASAKHSLKIYSQKITDYKIIDALMNAAQRHVDIKILTSQKQSPLLSAASGIQIHYKKNKYMHAKVIIIDNTIAEIGSINLTHASLTKNRELAVLTKSPQVLKPLIATFNKDWQ